jgi:hypothetical protein
MALERGAEGRMGGAKPDRKREFVPDSRDVVGKRSVP